MDPNANLYAQVKQATCIIAAIDHDRPVDENDAYQLAELVLAMDRWIRKGGFLPQNWTRKKAS